MLSGTRWLGRIERGSDLGQVNAVSTKGMLYIYVLPLYGGRICREVYRMNEACYKISSTFVAIGREKSHGRIRSGILSRTIRMECTSPRADRLPTSLSSRYSTSTLPHAGCSPRIGIRNIMYVSYAKEPAERLSELKPTPSVMGIGYSGHLFRGRHSARMCLDQEDNKFEAVE